MESVGGTQTREHQETARAIQSEFAKARGELAGRGFEQPDLDRYAAILQDEHHGESNGNPLTEINARKALVGPERTTPYVGSSGSAGADVTFRHDDGTVALAREVKTAGGGYRGFEAQVRQGAKQVNQGGEIFVQAPDGFTTDTGRRWVERFQSARSDQDLRKYDDVAVRFVSQGGDELGTYALGERLRSQ
jgi:hypothetical protein